MIQTYKDIEELKQVESKAVELVSLTFDVCEKRLASAACSVTQSQAALSAAALSVQQSVETFLAVSHIPDHLPDVK
jgi:hypothetical protein